MALMAGQSKLARAVPAPKLGKTGRPLKLKKGKVNAFVKNAAQIVAEESPKEVIDVAITTPEKGGQDGVDIADEATPLDVDKGATAEYTAKLKEPADIPDNDMPLRYEVAPEGVELYPKSDIPEMNVDFMAKGNIALPELNSTGARRPSRDSLLANKKSTSSAPTQRAGGESAVQRGSSSQPVGSQRNIDSPTQSDEDHNLTDEQRNEKKSMKDAIDRNNKELYELNKSLPPKTSESDVPNDAPGAMFFGEPSPADDNADASLENS